MKPTPRHSIVDKVAQFIMKHHLLASDKRYLVALSGGADSVSLLLILKELGFPVEAIHCNFNLRGDESLRDEQFCVDLCHQHHVILHRIHFDTLQYSSLHGVSIEMAARQLRYNYFSLLCRDIHADGVCVAHHQDDSIETVLMNLIKGTGLHGLTGIHYEKILTNHGDCRVLRPLLCLTRNEIDDYLKDQNQCYVTDSSNLSDNVMRNKIRLRVIPLLKQLNPSVGESIARTAIHLQEVAKVFDSAMVTSVSECTVPVSSFGCAATAVCLERLLLQPSPESTLFAILHPLGFSSFQVEQIFHSLIGQSNHVGKVFCSSGYNLLVDREQMIIEPNGIPPVYLTIPETGIYVVNESCRVRLDVEEVEATMGEKSAKISRDRHLATLDANMLRFPLTLRTVHDGDRFHPFGMCHVDTDSQRPPKLISDYMTDKKFSLFQKRHQLVVTDATGAILWLVGERTDHRYRVRPSTQRILSIGWESSAS